MATRIDFTMFTGDKRILELTVREPPPEGAPEGAVGDVVDVSGAVTDDIHWIMQTADDNPANQAYKRLGSGIAFKNTGSDGIIQVTIDEADTSSLDATEGDLAFPHQLSVDVSSRPAITMDGTVTIKARLLQTVNIDLEIGTFDVTTEYPAPFVTIS